MTAPSLPRFRVFVRARNRSKWRRKLLRRSRAIASWWLKPAPVQATYLGYVGPVPLPELDWMICDAVTVPPDQAGHYAPRPLPLSGCYQANDGREHALPAISRTAEGLPEDAVLAEAFGLQPMLAVTGAGCLLLAILLMQGLRKKNA